MIAEKIANLSHGGDRRSESFKLRNLSLKQSKIAKQCWTTPPAIAQVRVIKQFALEQAAKQLGTTPKAITQARIIKQFAPEEAALHHFREHRQTTSEYRPESDVLVTATSQALSEPKAPDKTCGARSRVLKNRRRLPYSSGIKSSRIGASDASR